MVHILSSQHPAPEISPREDKKPQRILDYNATKGAVGNADKLIREYSSARKTSRLASAKKTASHKRKLFINNLGKDLALHNMTMRANIKQIDTSTKSVLNACGAYASDNVGSASGTDTRQLKRGRLCVKEMFTGSSILSALCAKNSFVVNIVEKKNTLFVKNILMIND